MSDSISLIMVDIVLMSDSISLIMVDIVLMSDSSSLWSMCVLTPSFMVL